LSEIGGEEMRRRAQSTLEYAVVVAVVVGALLAMQYYMKRGVQGKLRESTDSIGEQYSAGNMTSKYSTEQLAEMKTKETFGLSDSLGYAKGTTEGISHYKIVTAAGVDRSALSDADAEKITVDLKGESLMPK